MNMIVHHAAVWSQSFLFMLCIKDRCVNVVLLFLCREMLYTGWHVRCIQLAGRGPLPQWAKGWWRETVSRWPGFFAPRNSGESLSALRDLTVQFKKNVVTDKSVKTSVCRINYEVVTYLVLDDWWWRKDSDSVSSLQFKHKTMEDRLPLKLNWKCCNTLFKGFQFVNIHRLWSHFSTDNTEKSFTFCRTLLLVLSLPQSDPVLLQDEEVGRHVQALAGLQAPNGAPGTQLWGLHGDFPQVWTHLHGHVSESAGNRPATATTQQEAQVTHTELLV